MSIVTVENLSKDYAGEKALKSISFSAEQGSIYGIIGADGAGKTTLIRILTTLIHADSGNASLMGYSVTNDFQKIRSSIGYMPQRFSLYQDLSVKENILFFADVFGISGNERKEAIKRLLAFSRLEKFQNRRAAHLSGGMKQKLALCCALIHKPQILLLDEPTTGVDPVSRKEFSDILSELKQQGITILVSTPYMDEADMCDKLMIIHKGSLLRDGSPEDLLSSLPYVIYQIENRQKTVHCPTSNPQRKGIHLIYPSAGTIHILADPSVITPDEMTSYVNVSLSGFETIRQVKPTIEDLFFYLVSDDKENVS
ncbi:MAG TPA: ABC transporter ATP-binding protein [Chitinispirillaceae bacterium]|nr:ABC transporter ATP-binding protein [Chitinispirillaceae bacterium]